MIILSTLLMSYAFADEPVLPRDAQYHVGEHITVCDTVREVSTPININSPYKIYFDNIIVGQHRTNIFSILIWRENLSNLEINPYSLYGREVCVSGPVKRYNERSISEIQMNLRSSSQIDIK